MSLRKHTDYNSYLTNLKYNNLGNFLSERNYQIVQSHINSLQNSVNNDYLKKTENVYISKTPNLKEVDLNSMTTIITQPIDLKSNFFSIFKLPANHQIQNGKIKNIINTCTIEENKLVYIHSTNSSGNGGFSNLGNLFNSYVFPCVGDNIELCWDSDKQNWCVKKYGGYFTNYEYKI